MSREPCGTVASRAWEVAFDATRIVFGAGSLERLGELLRETGGRRPFLVSDRGMREAGHLERASTLLESCGFDVAVFDGVRPNPTTRDVEETARAGGERRVDCIVALGGGSVLDCAKGANFVLTNGGRMADYRGTGRARREMLPSIAVPTTAGTGSDAQSYAVISDEETKTKMACGDRKAKYRAVILDAHLARTVPREVAAVSGMDAVSHAVESYVSTRRNPISQLLAREAWSLLDRAFPAVLADLADEEAWGRMLLGAHLAGSAIEHSMLGAAHACANPLTARFDLPHGSAVGLMLPAVMRFNAVEVGSLYDELARAGAAAPGALVDRVEELRSLAGLPARLAGFPIPRSSLTDLAQDAGAQWTAGFNPRPVGRDDLLELYEASW